MYLLSVLHISFFFPLDTILKEGEHILQVALDELDSPALSTNSATPGLFKFLNFILAYFIFMLLHCDLQLFNAFIQNFTKNSEFLSILVILEISFSSFPLVCYMHAY